MNDATSGRRISVCFVGLDNYAFLRPDLEIPSMGGEAVQQSLLARSFVAKGHTVSTIVLDYGQGGDEVIDGINIIKTYERGAGVKGLRFFHPRMSRIWKALRIANADVYYQSPAGVLTGVTAAYCRYHDKKFIFRIASDVNCVPGKQLIRLWRDRKIYEYGLRRADVRAVQTKKQANLLSQHYKLDCAIVNMVAEAEVSSDKCEKTIDVLWVNNLRSVKRPDRFVDVARKLPGYRFVMVGGACRGSEDLYEQIQREARQEANIEFVGSKSFAEVNAFLMCTKVLLNTSDIEGFPNTFLQAWMRGVPVVTMFDPDDLVKSRKLGAAATRTADLPDLLRRLLVSEKLLWEMSDRVAEFARREFSPEAVVTQYLNSVMT